MNELIKIQQHNDQNLVDARELHVFLESGRDFSNWIKDRISKYSFIENQDYVSFAKIVERVTGATTRIEYGLTIAMAKELSMVEGNAKGKQARRYFIEIELQIMMLVEEMEKRVKNHSVKRTLIVFDEFADAVVNSRKGNELNNYGEEITGYYKSGAPKTKRIVKSTDKSLEENLRLLLQKGRSSGFRIISATQRASTKVITGDAKVNFPVQVCFRVPKEVDSMVVIDEPGAESLNGRGDGLIKSPEYMDVIRFQAFYKE